MALQGHHVLKEPVLKEPSLKDHVLHSHAAEEVMRYSVETEASHVTDSAAQAADRAPFPKLVLRLSLCTILGSLVLLPMWFGGVHASSYLFERMLIALTLGAMWWHARPRLTLLFSRAPSLGPVLLIGILGFAGASLLHALILSLLSQPHPVLGTAGSLPSSAAFRESLSALLTGAALFILLRTWIGAEQHKVDFLVKILLGASFLVALTGLAHWFYDNGKLFWTFEPENVFSSPRARWPFVNANHLGHYLLLGGFLALGALRALTHDLHSVALSTQQSNKRSWKLLFQSSRVQHRIVRGIFLSLLIVCIGMAIIASLSRGAWIGASVGIFVFLALKLVAQRSAAAAEGRSPRGSGWTRFATRNNQPDDDGLQSSSADSTTRRGRRRRRETSSKHQPLTSDSIQLVFERLSRFAMPTFMLCGGLLAYFFLFGRGQELFLDRLQYGLLHSHADLRWQLYSDTLGMLREHWLLGVGLGGWAYWYPRYADPRMSGMDPVYLHSDPYQIMVESGLLGSLVLIVTAALVARAVIRAVRDSHGVHVSVLIGAASGVAALIVASLVDFPFRIPAIASAFIASLAIISFYTDKHRPIDSAKETNFEPA